MRSPRHIIPTLCLIAACQTPAQAPPSSAQDQGFDTPDLNQEMSVGEDLSALPDLSSQADLADLGAKPVTWPNVEPGMYDDVDPLQGIGPVIRVAPETIKVTTSNPSWSVTQSKLLVNLSEGRTATTEPMRPYLLSASDELELLDAALYIKAGGSAEDKNTERFSWCETFAAAELHFCWVHLRKLADRFTLLTSLQTDPQLEPITGDIYNIDGANRYGNGTWLVDAEATAAGTLYAVAPNIKHGTQHGGVLRFEEGDKPGFHHAFVSDTEHHFPVSITTSVDDKTLYMLTRGEPELSAPALWALPIMEDGSLGAPSKLLEGFGRADAITTDAANNLYIATTHQILVYSAAGAALGKIEVLPKPERDQTITGLAFGGSTGQTLYITYGIPASNGFVTKSSHPGKLFKVQAPIPGAWTVKPGLR